MLINTYLDTEDFVHLYYPEDESPPAAAGQGCGVNARLHTKLPPRPPSPDYDKITSSSDMCERERARAPPPPEPPPHRVRAADLYPRLRTHFDEPGLEPPFSTICGEFIQFVGRTAEGGALALSNYRVHVQARRRAAGASLPLRLIDAAEVRDLVQLVVLCKDGRTLRCTFNSGEQCLEWWRRLNAALAPVGSFPETFAAAYAAWAREQPPNSLQRALLSPAGAAGHWFRPELERLGFTTKGAWRVTAVNSDYKLCPSYPPLLVVPASVGDEDLDSVARFRAMRRIPAVVWRHQGNGAVIARSSQPEVGWLGWRSSEDERLLAAFVSACNADRGLLPAGSSKQTKLLIIDARSYASAVTNRARGGGCECQQYYPAADIQFMCLPNIHHVRRSFQQLRQLVAEPADQASWHSNLERTLWLQYISGLGRAASLVARAASTGRPVLVHCSDGWDRTPQIVAAAQLLLDPYYRTCEGFRVLIEREWLDFGHKFGDRCGHQFGPEEPNERSPIFLQWLDLVHQFMLQYPCSFEFSQAFLIKLLTHAHSCMFGTFLCNSARERAECRAGDAASVWTLLSAPAYRNRLYRRQHQVLWPDVSVRALHVWWHALSAPRAPDEHDTPPPPSPAPASAPHSRQHTNGVMTKTRSCDNLLNEERRTTQRRCSDPNIAGDVMKLLPGESVTRGVLTDSYADDLAMRGGADADANPGQDTRVALTDSYTRDLAARTDADADADSDQVDGLHPDHFENGSQSPPGSNCTRDLASNSSSLERELRPLEPATNGLLYTDVLESPPGSNCTRDLASNSSSLERELQPLEPTTNGLLYTDVLEAAREAGRQRQVSITWRSVSESSQHTDSSIGVELDALRYNNHNSTDGDVANHNVVDMAATLTNHNRIEPATNGAVTNGHPVDHLAGKLLEVELGGATSSSVSSESEGEGCSVRPRRPRPPAARGRLGSQLTLCGGSPRRPPHCCCRRVSTTSGIETSGDSLCGSGSPQCCCPGGGGIGGGAGLDEAPDGLPIAADSVQARLQQIILHQQMVVEQMSGELRAARAALRLASPPPAALPAPPTTAQPAQVTSSGSGSGSGSGSASGSGSEVEVGEEARGVVWIPDAAAPRCQHCRNHFWFARRRHHCRKCGGIFCGSCSEMSAVGEWASVRLCRRCRALR